MSDSLSPQPVTPVVMTEDEFKAALPKNMRKGLDRNVYNDISAKLTDPDMFQAYKENIIGFNSVLSQGKFKIDSYVDAVKYVTHKVQGKTNKDAYHLVFPHKHAEWMAKGVAPRDQDSAISSYNRGKLVGLIMAQTLTPLYIVNQDANQEAINKLVTLMRNAKSEKVQGDAATSLLTHLKIPETNKIELDVSVKTDSVIGDLRAHTAALVKQQREMLESGQVSAQHIAESALIIEGEVQDD